MKCLNIFLKCRLCPDGLYTYAVDIWSCGCIFAEMLGRNPIFPGKNFIHQLMLVFDVIGSPEAHQVRHIVNPEARKFLASQLSKPKVPYNRLYPAATPDAWWMLDQMLLFDPDKRITVQDALDSRYFAQCARHLPESLVFPEVGSEFEFNFERENLSRTQLKQLIVRETASLKREKMLQRQPSGPATIATVSKVHEEKDAKVAAQQQQKRQSEELSGNRPGPRGANANDAPNRENSGGQPLNGTSRPSGNRLKSSNQESEDDQQSQSTAGHAKPVPSYLKSTAASNTRSNSTSRLRPQNVSSLLSSATTANNTSDNRNVRRASSGNASSSAIASTQIKPKHQAATARDILREMMEPDAYDFLNIHYGTKQQQNQQSQPQATAIAAAVSAVTGVPREELLPAPGSPKRLVRDQPARKSVQSHGDHHTVASASVVQEVEDSLTARLQQAVLNSPQRSEQSQLTQRGGESKRVVDQSIAALHSPRRGIATSFKLNRSGSDADDGEELSPPPPPPPRSPFQSNSKASSNAPFQAPTSQSAHLPIGLPSSEFEGITVDSASSPHRKKSLMETYASPKRFSSQATGHDQSHVVSNLPLRDMLQRQEAKELEHQQQEFARKSYDSADEKEKNFLRRSQQRFQQQSQQHAQHPHSSSDDDSEPRQRLFPHHKLSSAVDSSSTATVSKSTSNGQANKHTASGEALRKYYQQSQTASQHSHGNESEEAHTYDNGEDDRQLLTARTAATAYTTGTNATTVVAGVGAKGSQNRDFYAASSSVTGGNTRSSNIIRPNSAVRDGVQRNDSTSATSNATSAAIGATHNGNPAGGSGEKVLLAGKKTKITVPKSPKFSTMSWQRRAQQGAHQQGYDEIVERENMGIPAATNAASSRRLSAGSTGVGNQNSKARAMSTGRFIPRKDY